MKIKQDFLDEEFDLILEKYRHSQGQGDLAYRRILLGQLLLERHEKELRSNKDLHFEVLLDLVKSYFHINQHTRCQLCAELLIKDLSLPDKVKAIHQYQLSKGITGDRSLGPLQFLNNMSKQILEENSWLDENLPGDTEFIYKYANLIEIEISILKLRLANYSHSQELPIEAAIRNVNQYIAIVNKKGLFNSLNEHFFQQIQDHDLLSRIQYYEGSFLYKKGLFKESLKIFEQIVKNKTGVDRAVTLNRIAQNYLSLHQKNKALECFNEAR